MSVKFEPKTKEEFIQALKLGYNYTDEQIQEELDNVERRIKEFNITDEEQLKQEYTVAYSTIIVEEIIND